MRSKSFFRALFTILAVITYPTFSTAQEQEVISRETKYELKLFLGKLSNAGRNLYSDKFWEAPQDCEHMAEELTENIKAFYDISGGYKNQMGKICAKRNRQYAVSYRWGDYVCTKTTILSYRPIWIPDWCQLAPDAPQCKSKVKDLCEKYFSTVRSDLNDNGGLFVVIGIGDVDPCEKHVSINWSCDLLPQEY